MKVYLSSIIVLVILVTCGCSPNNVKNQNNLTGTDEMNVEYVTLEIEAPFSDALITVRNGTVVYEASSQETGIERARDGRNITAEEYDELVKLINHNGYFLFKDNYIDDTKVDEITYTITVWAYPASVKKQAVSLASYPIICYFSCPVEITQIMDQVKELWGKDILIIGTK